MSSSQYKQPNSSLASYEPSKPYPQLDGHSDSRRNIPEGGLAKDNVSVMTIKPQDNTLPTITKATLCHIPCPFVKNFNRHACIQHHSLITHNANIPLEVEATSTPTINIIHHKSFHANVIYEKYNSNSRQKIFSNRLGISYTTRYDAHDLNLILPPNKAIGSMYTKIYENFSRTISSNPRTAVRQKAYFDRSCRRIFSSNKPKSGMALKLRHKIRLANQRKFLFYPYQKICKRLPHLKFNMGLFKRFPTVPLFRFPYDRNCALLHLYEDRILPSHITPGSSWVIKNQDSDEEDDSSADNGRDDTSENSYRDWYITNLIDEHYGKGASEYIDAIQLLEDSTIQLSLRDAYMLGLNEDCIAEIKARDRLNERVNVIKDIRDHNTSAKHYLRRTNAMDFFTQMNDNFNDRMANIRIFAYGAHMKKGINKRSVASKRLNNLITDFGEKYRVEYPSKRYRAIIRPNNVEYIKDDLSDTSDDTKILERRPKKRRARYTHYNNYGDLIPLTKKLCIFDCRDTKEEDFLPSNIDLIFKFRV
ncbi:8825_t:CDS:2 [Rhizophagus irregularis]|nr:8825_t:CDS:2 [Rhizophagus irregularis]